MEFTYDSFDSRKFPAMVEVTGVVTNMVWDPSPETLRRLADEARAVDEPLIVEKRDDGSGPGTRKA
jgi:hypothetical protein